MYIFGSATHYKVAEILLDINILRVGWRLIECHLTSAENERFPLAHQLWGQNSRCTSSSTI